MSYSSANFYKAMLIDSHLRVGEPHNFIDYKIIDDIHIEITDEDALLIEDRGQLYLDYSDSDKKGRSAKGLTGFIVDDKFIIDNERDMMGREKVYSICHYDLAVIIKDIDCYFNSAAQEVGLLREPIESISGEEDYNEEEIL